MEEQHLNSNYMLLIEDYCENCPEFEVVDRDEEFFYDDFYYPPTKKILHTITCKHRKRCSNMVDWLRKNENKKEKKDGCTEN